MQRLASPKSELGGRRRLGRASRGVALASVAALLFSGCFSLQKAAGCNDPGVFGCRHEAPERTEPERTPRRAPFEHTDSVAPGGAAYDASPAFVGTRWRLASLGGAPPVAGARPVLVFTDEPAERDAYDRTYPARFTGWRLVTGESGVGRLHAPYWRDGDALRFADPYDETRLSTDAEIAQARRLADALVRVRSFAHDGRRLLLLGEGGYALATFTADPPRSPSPLDDVEWVLTSLDGAPVPEGVRATLAFSSRRLGPGPGDGFDAYGGYSGCNWYGGGYVLDAAGDGVYRLTTDGAVAGTQRGCASLAAGVEAAFYRALLQVTQVRTAGDRLLLTDPSGSERLAFRRHVPHRVDLDALHRGRWLLVSVPAGRSLPAEPAIATFADATFEVAVGCHRRRGAYHVDGDDFVIPRQEADDNACTRSERRSPPEIPITNGKLAVTDDRLTLYDENGRATTFVRPGSQPEETRR